MNLLACLKSFTVIVNNGSFVQAARKLFVSPSKLSKQITWLEEELKVTLFRRSTRNLELTDEGNLLYEKSVHILAELENIKEAISHFSVEPKGILRLHLPVSFAEQVVVPIVIKFIECYPEVEFRIVSRGLLVALVEGSFDVAIHTSILDDPSFENKKIWSLQRQIVGAPAYFAKHGIPKTPEELRAHNCLVNTHVSKQTAWQFKYGRQEKSVNVSGNFQSNDNAILRRAALAGLGLIWIGSDFVAKDIKEGRLQIVLADYPSLEVPVFAIYHKHHSHSAKIRSFINMLEQEAPHALKNAL
jgi:DNA-binding transcriptional LysR family regulator